MLTGINKSVHCLSCHFNCELGNLDSVKKLNCIDSKYGVWPESNFYLVLGIDTLLTRPGCSHIHRGFIFVDFSWYHIRRFTNGLWLEHLTKTGLKLILVADKSTEALASYWYSVSVDIAMVIYVAEGKSVIEQKIERIICGRIIREPRRKKFSELEIMVLRLFLDGCTVKQIAAVLNLKLKRVYNIKCILQNKIGGRLNTIISG
ncbi:response regulator transcription factor [Enterobacteriaceae bacterium BIT-l23]|uniref:response regulator transcription factor n=1 Tax=Jejubacter sp. L23 TaxID=3092086 RepID=UPI0015849F0D|nr:response regulator transcription factor [Enterobacteriaceae bacterium BIT-l23]